MFQRLAMAALAALTLAGCEPPNGQIFVSPAYDQAWARERQLCANNPNAAHCDVYLRNPVPPAPYSTDGILIAQRRLCFESRSVADCTLAQRLGRDAEAQTGRGVPAAESATLARPAAEEDDFEEYVPAPVTGGVPFDAGATTLRRPRRPAATEALPGQCSPAALESLDLVEAPVRAAILRRCASARR